MAMLHIPLSEGKNTHWQKRRAKVVVARVLYLKVPSSIIIPEFSCSDREIPWLFPAIA
jgi:hypothetical protein